MSTTQYLSLICISGSLLLESKIQPDTAYQKQQETLIVWSEGDNFDLALSFQEKAGCDEIWEKICQVNYFKLHYFINCELMFFSFRFKVKILQLISLKTLLKNLKMKGLRTCQILHLQWNYLLVN